LVKIGKEMMKNFGKILEIVSIGEL
jgi:hypothetical protein